MRIFCPHLGSFCVVSSFTTFRPNFTSGLLQVILPQPRIGMLSLVTVSPVITAFHSCCLSHHVFDQVNLWLATVTRLSIPILVTKREGSTFGAHRREANLHPNGAAQVGGQMNKTAKKSLCVFEFWDSYVLS